MNGHAQRVSKRIGLAVLLATFSFAAHSQGGGGQGPGASPGPSASPGMQRQADDPARMGGGPMAGQQQSQQMGRGPMMQPESAQEMAGLMQQMNGVMQDMTRTMQRQQTMSQDQLQEMSKAMVQMSDGLRTLAQAQNQGQLAEQDREQLRTRIGVEHDPDAFSHKPKLD